MNYTVEIVDEEHLINSCSLIILEELKANTYAIIKIDNIKVGVKWNSQNLANPQIEDLCNNLSLIIIGYVVVMFDYKYSSVRLLLNLGEPYNFLEQNSDFICVFSERSLVIINKFDFSISQTRFFPDIILDAKITNRDIVIKGVSENFVVNF